MLLQEIGLLCPSFDSFFLIEVHENCLSWLFGRVRELIEDVPLLGLTLCFLSEYEDDKISLPFVVTDLRGRNLKPLKERAVCQVRVIL